MTDQPDELFSAVDSLLAAVDDGTVLPTPAERTRLREAAGLTEAAVAQALGVRVPSIQAWEAGRAEPKGDRLDAYRRLLDGLTRRYPAPATAALAPPPGSSVPDAPSPRPAVPATESAPPPAPTTPPTPVASSDPATGAGHPAVPAAVAGRPSVPADPRPVAPPAGRLRVRRSRSGGHASADPWTPRSAGRPSRTGGRLRRARTGPARRGPAPRCPKARAQEGRPRHVPHARLRPRHRRPPLRARPPRRAGRR
ncbi:helix-turn-helix transcriptional regulator [Streptomyces sp. MUSC 14]|uniref:helix-turn-helix domain-containing protein n=1 Tax=Streptomyces sp. MUSC 14 TaxID=1354889 RepID=UPI002109B080|nr:helix-turn-helix transcriptional regulator [Streptomyces sp. MUSC 14]